MIEYSIKDLLIVILKKFYIIILGIICFALLAIYNGEVSYQKALDNYSKYTTEENISTLSERVEHTFCLISCSSKRGVEWTNADSAYIVYTLLCNSTLQKNLSLENKIDMTLIANSNVILFESDVISREEFAGKLDAIKKALQTPAIEKSINIQYGDIDSSFSEPSQNYAQEIMKKPSKIAHKIQLCIRGGILGFLISIVFILILEYIKRNKQNNKGKI